MRHCLRCLIVIACYLFISPGVQSQIPKNEIAPENAAFYKAFGSRPIPTVTGKLLNISAEKIKSLSFTGYAGHAFIDKKGQYRSGVINGIRDIPDRNALTALINR